MRLIANIWEGGGFYEVVINFLVGNQPHRKLLCRTDNFKLAEELCNRINVGNKEKKYINVPCCNDCIHWDVVCGCNGSFHAIKNGTTCDNFKDNKKSSKGGVRYEKK